MSTSTSKKYIGINQRVPFSLLDESLKRFLASGELDRSELMEEILTEMKGHNRAEKATQYAWQILTRPKAFIRFILKNISPAVYSKLPQHDRKAISLCLVANTYPITYDLLSTVAKVLKVQDQVSRAFINQKMAALYGSNRTLDIAIDALMTMLVELGALSRVKIGFYTRGERPRITNKAVSELYIATDIRLSGSKSIVLDEINHRSWFYFYRVDLNEKAPVGLLKFTEGRIGRGYLSLV